MEECEPVYLEPFIHQVGGHSHMFSYDSTTVCKPLIDREYHFYQTVPESLKEFTPDFKGIVEVAFVEDSDGYYNITLAGTPTGSPIKGKRKVLSNAGNSPGSSGGEGGKSDSSDSDPSSPKRATAKKSSTETEETLRVVATARTNLEMDPSPEVYEVKNEDTKVKIIPGCLPNPWSIRCHKMEMDKMRKANSGLGPKKFILLENVVSHLHYPCILDLKMGTRQHGDDETEAKRETKIRRCQNTTSGSIGLRVCGMQIYQRDTGQFICQNKFYGRQLSSERFHEALYQFLHDGIAIRVDLIDQILERLRQLHSLLSKQNTYRFYSSSLLIMYDGKERKTTESWKQPATATTTCIDKENNAKTWKVNSTEEADRSHSSRNSDRRGDSLNHSSPERSRSREYSHKNGRHDSKHGCVDVRMIDFAHTTQQGFHNDRQRSGPDRGYLFGLANLIKMFEDIKRQNS